MSEQDLQQPEQLTSVVVTNPSDHALTAQTALFVAQVDGDIAPDFAQGAMIDNSRTAMYVRPTRVRYVQGSSAPELKARFPIGSVVAVPNLSLISPVLMNEHNQPSDQGAPFDFIPVFMYTEYLAWNPTESKGVLPSVRERSFDPTSEIARRARDFKNPKAREVPCPEFPNYNIRFQEHLNFIIMVLNGDMYLKPMVQSFARTSFKAGVDLITLWTNRNAYMHACIFTQQGQLMKNDKNQSWYVPTIRNPLPRPQGAGGWVREKEIFDYAGQQAEYFKAVYEQGLLQTDYDEVDGVDPNSNYGQLQAQQREDLKTAKY